LASCAAVLSPFNTADTAFSLKSVYEADTIIDFGPGGGTSGGEIVAIDTSQEVFANKNSLTGQCLKAHFGF